MCTSPLRLEDRIVKCGHCIECLIGRSQEWAFRLEYELKDAQTGIFLTLTYDQKNAIWLDYEETMITTLDKTDVQKFIKRLRKKQGNKETQWNKKIRYFAVGEYGTKTKRAHYHLIIYNLKKNVINDLQKIWGKGHIKIGDVNEKSIRYVTNYMLLKNVDLLEGQQIPFTLMSKKPILGARYVINNYMTHHENQSFKLIHKQKQDKRKSLYRIYNKKIYTEEEQQIVKKKKMDHYQKFIDLQKKESEEKCPLDPPEYLREKNKKKAENRQLKFKVTQKARTI